MYVRTGADMFKRRGGLKYFKKYKNGRKIILQTGIFQNGLLLYIVGFS